jgi:hypothetical protein
MIQEQIDAISSIAKIEELPRGALNFAYVLGSLPFLEVVVPMVIESYVPWIIRWWDTVMGKGHRFGTAGLLFVLAGFWVDDIGTAIGLQAEEVPREMVEGNHYMSGAWQFLIDNGLAKTQTDAHRLVGIYFTVFILVAQYFGWLNSFARFSMFGVAMTKAWAGSNWWQNKPNNYTVTDYLSFKPGRLTNERLSYPMRIVFNLQKGYNDPIAAAQGITLDGQGNVSVGGTPLITGVPGGQRDILSRRRLATQNPTPGVTWLTRYLPIIFPFI